ncbi:MAG TPA: DUF2252 family protein [Candidatus Dormibacteraeota bacterium]|nr:DUF2252 family protein [Candidatus Dormibacteraeota bacterium]
MNILEATKSYDHWMRSCTTVVESHLRSKHELMREDLFLFFRGTFYRWAQLWPEICSPLCPAPKVLACGDLHVGSFGTWRDSEGRLCWGVDDFDESYPLPYTNDLVRLAASAKIAIDVGELNVRLRDACDAILEGYEQTLKIGGCPMVLAEREASLEKLGFYSMKFPEDFWKTLTELPHVKNVPREAKQAIEIMLPGRHLEYKVVRREAGMGSLGQQRFVAIAKLDGGFIAREAKAMLPSACVWLTGHKGRGQSCYQDIIQSAVRSRDPFQRIIGPWLIRRLSPDSNPIEINELPAENDEEILLCAMGSEAANVHLGTKAQTKKILKDLRARKPQWLRNAAKDIAKTIEREWKEYRKS